MSGLSGKIRHRRVQDTSLRARPTSRRRFINVARHLGCATTSKPARRTYGMHKIRTARRHTSHDFRLGAAHGGNQCNNPSNPHPDTHETNPVQKHAAPYPRLSQKEFRACKHNSVEPKRTFGRRPVSFLNRSTVWGPTGAEPTRNSVRAKASR